MNKPWKYILGFLTLGAVVVWLALFTLPDSNLHLIACDVGQGDAILATYKTTQILVDGGPDNSVLDCLSRHLPFWDHEIELIVLTHPQKDHYQGLIEVIRRYKVDNFLSNGLDSGNEGYRALKKEVGSRGTPVIHSDGGMVIGLDLMRLEILHPSAEFMGSQAVKLSGSQAGDPLALYVSKDDPNNFSIVAILSFGDFDALLTGDLGPEAGDRLAEDGTIKTVEYLKVPHHGSKNGLTQTLLEIVSPEVAVISSGKHNSYGHPHKEILDMLNSHGVRILRTDEIGDIEIVSDGKTWWGQ